MPSRPGFVRRAVPPRLGPNVFTLKYCPNLTWVHVGVVEPIENGGGEMITTNKTWYGGLALEFDPENRPSTVMPRRTLTGRERDQRKTTHKMASTARRRNRR